VARLKAELEGLLRKGPVRLPLPAVEAQVLLHQARADLPQLLRGDGPGDKAADRD
jgi:hypothetical protein